MNGGYKLRLEGVGMLSRCRSKGSVSGEGNSSCKRVDIFTDDFFLSILPSKVSYVSIGQFYFFKPYLCLLFHKVILKFYVVFLLFEELVNTFSIYHQVLGENILWHYMKVQM